MRGWRRRIFLVLLAYAAVTTLWATRPWTDTQRLETPPDAPLQFAEYGCPSVFYAASDHPAASEEAAYRPDGAPCGEQSERRALFFVDIAAAVVGMLLLKRSSSRHRAAIVKDEARAAALSGP